MKYLGLQYVIQLEIIPIGIITHLDLYPQGRFLAEDYEKLDLPESARQRFLFEDGNPNVYTEDSPGDEEEPMVSGGRIKKINWMQAALTAADKILTVSPNYATEIMSSPQKGVELNEVIK